MRFSNFGRGFFQESGKLFGCVDVVRDFRIGNLHCEVRELFSAEMMDHGLMVLQAKVSVMLRLQ